jgi:hypothetical protein
VVVLVGEGDQEDGPCSREKGWVVVGGRRWEILEHSRWGVAAGRRWNIEGIRMPPARTLLLVEVGVDQVNSWTRRRKLVLVKAGRHVQSGQSLWEVNNLIFLSRMPFFCKRHLRQCPILSLSQRCWKHRVKERQLLPWSQWRRKLWLCLCKMGLNL